tara:strand:+ start:150 stop:446 length:297 start_codon:yes stop_codon:yes gene_type:complete
MKQKPNTLAQRVVRRQNAHYRLVIYFKEGVSKNPNNKPRVFYSYPKYDHRGDLGKIRLIRLVTVKYKGKYITALLYNNLSGQLIKKWVGSLVEAGKDE